MILRAASVTGGMKLRRFNFAIWSVATFSVVMVVAGANGWRTASESELKRVIPARAPVIKENIETEFRTASGVTDGQGRFIAGVVMITAGYSAEGKYSHFFITQVPLRMGDLSLKAGQYVFGYQRKNADSIDIAFYEASSGESLGSVEAHVSKSSMVRSFLITPPSREKGSIQIGRFLFEYRLQ